MSEPNETKRNRLLLELAELEREWSRGMHRAPAIRSQMRPLSILAFVALFAAPLCMVLSSAYSNLLFIWIAVACLVVVLVLGILILRLRLHPSNGEDYVQVRQALQNQIQALEKK